jgi:hypothetical protein
VFHVGIRDHDHAVAGQPHAAAQVHVVADARQCGVESAHVLEDVAAHEHARSVHAEGVGDGVELALIHLVRSHAVEAVAGRGQRQPHLEEAFRAGFVELLGAGNGDGGGLLHGVEQPLEGVRARGAVVMDQPQPFGDVIRAAIREMVQRLTDGLAEALSGGVEHHGVLRQSRHELGPGSVHRAGVDAEAQVWDPRLGTQPGQGRVDEGGAVVRDDEGCDQSRTGNQFTRFLRRRRSRSERPPQIPKRSSLSRA